MNTQSTTMMERAPFLLPDVAMDTEFSREKLAQVRAYANSFKEQIELIPAQRIKNIEAETGKGVEMERPARVMPDNEGHFEVGAEIDGGRDELPL